jgi:hypothetical protein
VRQTAPDPDVLASLVRRCGYRDGWQMHLEDIDRGQGSEGLTLIITTDTEDSYHPGVRMRVHHYMPVPPAAFDERSWRRWLFDQFLLVERHEAMEYFTIDGAHVYAPSHGPGNDPYIVREIGTAEDQETSFRGVRKHRWASGG